MKTGAYPMKVKLKLFFKWGIEFGEPYVVPDHGSRPVQYASREKLMKAIREKYPPKKQPEEIEPSTSENLNAALDKRKEG